ncbi:DUF5050 domain-containing protein [Paenibacillaceae bacterium]|nr:DUF5050 domain-containing protein [Paenibacillaceae bacterium]
MISATSRMANLLKNVTLSLLAFALLATVWSAEPGRANAQAVNSAATVYYLSDGDLFRVKNDGTPSELLISDYEGAQLKQAGDALYYYASDDSMTLLRFPLKGSAAEPSNFSGNKRIVSFETAGKFVYFVDDTGKLYRAASTSQRASEATLIADKIDLDYASFSVIEGRVYFNAIRNGRATWVGSRSAVGKGAIEWIAAGALESEHLTSLDGKNVHLIINTDPEERVYSTDCMVMYTVPAKGGKAKAVNAKSPLDANAVYSGLWAGPDSYVYNQGIKLDVDGEYNYKLGKGMIINKDGRSFAISQNAIYEIAMIAKNKYAIVDGSDKAFVNTISNYKVASSKRISLFDVYYTHNVAKDDKQSHTVIFARQGIYTVNADASLKNLVGDEWATYMTADGLDAIFYTDASKDRTLHQVSPGNKKVVKLADEYVTSILLITKG